MTRVGPLLLAATCSCLVALLPLAAAQYCSGNRSADGGNYQFSWTTNNFDSTVTFTVSAPATTTTWVAIGFSADQFMPNTDVIIGASDGMSPFVEDRYASARARPSLDSTESITSASATLSGGTTTLEFTRAIDTGDSTDDISLDQPRYVLWAYGGSVTYGNPNMVNQHSDRGVFSAQIDFSACDAVSFTSFEITADEGTLDPVTVCVAVDDGVANTDISGNVSTIDGSATVGSDYDAPDGTNFVIAAGTAQACVNFTIIDDDALESNESFTLHLSITTLGVNTGGLIYSSVIIIDNDAAATTVSLQMPAAVMEGSGTADICVDVSPPFMGTEVDIVVDLEITNGTAVAGADFNVSDSTITIEPPVITPTTHCISIAIIDDNVYEEDEYLNIMIDSVTPSVTVGTPSVVQLTIQDDDEVVLQFEQAAQTITEDTSMPVLVCLEVTSSFSIETPLSIYLDLEGSATNGTDYILTNGNAIITFLPPATSGSTACATIQVYNDNIIEEDETIVVTAVTGTLPRGVTIGMQSSHTITIEDDEPTSTPVEFEFSKYLGAEGSVVSVCIRPVYALEIMNVIVTMTAVSGTADESDYTFMPTDLTLSSGFECASVSLVSDSMPEDVESFYMVLSSVSPYIVDINDIQVKVSIYDEDSCPIDPEGSICKDILFLKLCQYIEEQSSTLPMPCLTVREKYSSIMHTGT